MREYSDIWKLLWTKLHDLRHYGDVKTYRWDEHWKIRKHLRTAEVKCWAQPENGLLQSIHAVRLQQIPSSWFQLWESTRFMAGTGCLEAITVSVVIFWCKLMQVLAESHSIRPLMFSASQTMTKFETVGYMNGLHQFFKELSGRVILGFISNAKITTVVQADIEPRELITWLGSQIRILQASCGMYRNCKVDSWT